MIGALIRRSAGRAAARDLNRASGHDVTPGPHGLVHHSVCPCGLGMRVLSTRRDWRDLAQCPITQWSSEAAVHADLADANHAGWERGYRNAVEDYQATGHFRYGHETAAGEEGAARP